MDEFQSAIAVVRAAPITAPGGWRLVAKTPYEGLQTIAFSGDESLVVARSCNGVSAFSCTTGEPIESSRQVEELPPLSCSADGWSTESLAIDWPQVTLLLRQPGFSNYVLGGFFVVARPADVVTFGFSQSGIRLVLATEHGFALWERASLIAAEDAPLKPDA